jgi:hypothetical protein
MSDEAVCSVDEQIGQAAERLIAIFEDEFEWIEEQGDRDRLTQLLEGAREAELLVSEARPPTGARAALIERASQLVSQVVASIDEASPR